VSRYLPPSLFLRSFPTKSIRATSPSAINAESFRDRSTISLTQSRATPMPTPRCTETAAALNRRRHRRPLLRLRWSSPCRIWARWVGPSHTWQLNMANMSIIICFDHAHKLLSGQPSVSRTNVKMCCPNAYSARLICCLSSAPLCLQKFTMSACAIYWHRSTTGSRRRWVPTEAETRMEMDPAAVTRCLAPISRFRRRPMPCLPRHPQFYHQPRLHPHHQRPRPHSSPRVPR
jgi:hypothetical protein